MKFGAIVGLAVLSLACPTAAQAAWSGWARCELEITGPAYKNSETHDWFVTNATQGTRVPGIWIVTGSGEWSPSAQLSRWSISSGVSTGQSTDFEVRVSGGQVSIVTTSNPSISGGIAGYTIPTGGGSMPISASQSQWAFPSVMGPIGQTELRGSRPGVDAPGWGLLRPPGSTMMVNCTWWFRDGSTPSPPPSVTPPTTPVPPQTPIASGVTIAGTPVFRNVLTGNYNYFDANNDREGTSTFRWLRDGVAISGQTARSYTLLNADVGKMVSFEVTPVAQSGPSPGSRVESSRVGPVTCPTKTRFMLWRSISDFFRDLLDLFRGRRSGETLVDPCP